MNQLTTAEGVFRSSDQRPLASDFTMSSRPFSTASRIVEHFGGLARLQRATVPDLMEVEGVDDATAASIKDTLQRVTETAILDQYS